MENRKFNIAVEEKTESLLALRFFSDSCVNLHVLDEKFFYKHDKYDIPQIRCLRHIYLNNSYKIIEFPYDGEHKYSYTSVNVIVKDITNKQQYGVRVELAEEKIFFTPMTCNG